MLTFSGAALLVGLGMYWLHPFQRGKTLLPPQKRGCLEYDAGDAYDYAKKDEKINSKVHFKKMQWNFENSDDYDQTLTKKSNFWH